jgi:hypothetical protein
MDKVIVDGWYRLKPYHPARGGHKHTTRHLFNGGRRICSRWQKSEPDGDDPLANLDSPKCGLCLKLLACSKLTYVDPEQTDLTDVVPLGRPRRGHGERGERSSPKPAAPMASAPQSAVTSTSSSSKPSASKIPTVAERLEQIRLAKLAKAKK